MKKLIVILLLFVYGITSAGATIHLHYCMDKYAGWSMWHSDKEKCGKCGMTEMKGGCCKDEHKQLKLSTDQNHKLPHPVLLQQFFVPVLLTSNFIYNFSQQHKIAVQYPKNNAPPNQSRLIYMSNCVFLI